MYLLVQTLLHCRREIHHEVKKEMQICDILVDARSLKDDSVAD